VDITARMTEQQLQAYSNLNQQKWLVEGMKDGYVLIKQRGDGKNSKVKTAVILENGKVIYA